MHILYLHQYFCPPGGVGNNRSFELARHWVRAGHEVTFITSEAYFPKQHDFYPPKNYPESFEVEGIKVYVLDVPYSHLMPFPRRVLSFLQFYRQALKLGKQLSAFDVIYASSTPLTIGELGRKLAAYHQKPFVFETVDVWPDVPIGMGVIRSKWLIDWLFTRTRMIYDAASHIVSLSEGMKAQVLSQGVADNQVTVVHNGVDVEKIRFVERGFEPKDRVELLYAGTVGMANGLTQLVQAMHWIEQQGRKDVHCTIVGKGNDWENVKAEANRLGVQQITFKDFVPKDEIEAVLKQADIGIVCFANYPVLEANSANKFYDYLANGLPMVLNYEGWQAKYIREWGCGLATKQGNVEAFGRNILRLADDAEMRKRFSENGRRLAEESFDRGKLAGVVLDVLGKSLGK